MVTIYTGALCGYCAMAKRLLDSKAVNAVAGRLPVVGQGFDWMREAMRDSRAKRLAGLLADPQAAAAALESFSGRTQGLLSDPLLLGLYRGAPLTASGQ